MRATDGRRWAVVTAAAGTVFIAAGAFWLSFVSLADLAARSGIGAGQAWVEHILAHPAMLEWERQALAESWREVGHEEELRTCGAITADYRTRS